MKSFPAEVLLVEKPVVRENVANLASSMAQRRGDFDLLRGRRCGSDTHRRTQMVNSCLRSPIATVPFARCAESRSGRGLPFRRYFFKWKPPNVISSLDFGACFAISTFLAQDRIAVVLTCKNQKSAGKRCSNPLPPFWRKLTLCLQVREEDAAQPFMLEAETNSFMFQGLSQYVGSTVGP